MHSGEGEEVNPIPMEIDKVLAMASRSTEYGSRTTRITGNKARRVEKGSRGLRASRNVR